MTESPAGVTAEAEHKSETSLLRPGYTRWLMVVLLVVSVMNFADRAILAVLAQPIKEDLNLTDTDLGLLQGLGFDEAINFSFIRKQDDFELIPAFAVRHEEQVALANPVPSRR